MATPTYAIAATRAGQSAFVTETTTKTYVVALPAVLQEGGSGAPTPPSGAPQAQAIMLA
jgi:hypothetical protein